MRVLAPRRMSWRMVVVHVCLAALLPFAERLAAQSASPEPPAPWVSAEPATLGLDPSLLDRAADYALKGGGAGMIIYRGKVVRSWGDTKARFDIKSSTKSIGSIVLGLALGDGKLELDQPVFERLPEIASELPGSPGGGDAKAWARTITPFHLATHTAGFDKPGGFQPLLFAPGTQWSYSDGGPNWLADLLTRIYQRDLADLLFERVFQPLGVTRDDLQWRDNAYRPRVLDGVPRREFGSGVHANVDALARIGFFFARAGGIGERRILPSDFVARLRSSPQATRSLPVHRRDQYPDASRHYGLLWWNNTGGQMAGAPRDLYWAWGLGDSLIAVIPSLDLVIARAGRSLAEPGREATADFARLRPLIESAIAAVPASEREARPPYPPSPVFSGIEWESLEQIRRAAHGCDNWPMTWTARDTLIGACGDGWGFAPFLPKKMGLVFAEIEGAAGNFTGRNLSTNLDNRGMGAAGEKASGLLAVEGVLYVLLRNAGNAQLAWSVDGGEWTRASWKFTRSFGHPAFLNFGRDYAGARDRFVYLYSPDSDNAYDPSPRLVLARVPKDRLQDQTAYEYFVRLADGRPIWSKKVDERGAVLQSSRDLCYRTQVSYHAPSRRYLLTYAIPGPVNGRFQGGIAIFDAPEPWGPWTTVSYDRLWDSAPGESLSFPVKWMDPDGRTVYLSTSADDALSVRKGVLQRKR